jgi:hypothetical protein
VVSGVSLCIRPNFAPLGGTALLSVGWPETARQC